MDKKEMEKKMENKILILLTIAAVILFAFASCIKGSTNPIADKVIKTVEEAYPQDNVVEEAIEKKIEDLTGLEVDLSPCSPEKSDIPGKPQS